MQKDLTVLHDKHKICVACEQRWKRTCDQEQKDYTCPLCNKVLLHQISRGVVFSNNLLYAIYEEDVSNQEVEDFMMSVVSLANLFVQGVQSALHSR